MWLNSKLGGTAYVGRLVVRGLRQRLGSDVALGSGIMLPDRCHERPGI